MPTKLAPDPQHTPRAALIWLLSRLSTCATSPLCHLLPAVCAVKGWEYATGILASCLNRDGRRVPKGGAPSTLLGGLDVFAMSALAKLGATLATYPLLVIKSRLQVRLHGGALQAFMLRHGAAGALPGRPLESSCYPAGALNCTGCVQNARRPAYCGTTCLQGSTPIVAYCGTTCLHCVQNARRPAYCGTTCLQGSMPRHPKHDQKHQRCGHPCASSCRQPMQVLLQRRDTRGWWMLWCASWATRVCKGCTKGCG